MPAATKPQEKAGSFTRNQQIVHRQTALGHCRYAGISAGTGPRIKRFTPVRLPFPERLFWAQDELVGDE
jgi:hypothetical protein